MNRREIIMTSRRWPDGRCQQCGETLGPIGCLNCGQLIEEDFRER